MEPETVEILDENDEVCEARVYLCGGRVVGQKEDGIYLFPGSFIVLSEASQAFLAQEII